MTDKSNDIWCYIVGYGNGKLWLTRKKGKAWAYRLKDEITATQALELTKRQKEGDWLFLGVAVLRPVTSKILHLIKVGLD